MNILEALNIPESGQTHQWIPIKTMVDSLNIEKKDEKLLRSHIESIYLEGILNETTINIKATKDESMVYEEIHILYIKLKKRDKFSSLNQRLHTFFPNPTLIIFDHQGLTLSIADKRINRQSPGRAIVEEVYTTQSFDPEANNHASFLETLNLKKIETQDLKAFYESLIRIIYQERLIHLIGIYPSKLLEPVFIKNALKRIEAYQSDLNQIQEDEKSANTMQDRMNIHMRQNEVQSKIESVKEEIKEAISHGQKDN